VNGIPSTLLVVTDRHQAPWPLEEIVAEVLSAGARWIWFRDRDLEIAKRRQVAVRLSKLVRGAGGCLSIGGDVDLAVEAGTNAVHVRDFAAIAQARRRLGPAALVGLSAHSIADVADAHAAGADYVTLSPIYQSPSKPGYGPPLGPGMIERAAQIGIPIVALGGISASNAAVTMHAGAAGVAVMGSVMAADRPAVVIDETLQLISGRVLASADRYSR
jgi:thiamine-phosphate pyrophosphorylase